MSTNEQSGRRSVITRTLATLLNTLGSTSTDCLENPIKENYHFYLAECLTSAFQQIRTNLDFQSSDHFGSIDSLKASDTERASHIRVLHQLTEMVSANSSARLTSGGTTQLPLTIKPTHDDPLTAEHRKRFHKQLTRCSSMRIPKVNRQITPSQSMPDFSLSPNLTAMNSTLDSCAELGSSWISSSPDDDNPLFRYDSLESSYNDLLSDSESDQCSPSSITFMPNVLGNSLRSDIDLSSESMLGVSSVQNDLANSYLSDSELTTYLNDVQRENGKIAAATNQTADNLPETVAINLIKSFTSLERSFKPDPNQIEWLVSEEQAPQKLLPLPSKVLLANEQIARSASLLPFSGDSVNITCKSSPSYAKSDKCFESNECTPLDKPIKLRGNEEWAPPRPQLIFHVHTPIKRNLALVKQNFRCAGCGMKVDKAYISRMLYCHYTAKYFCQYGCHSGARHVLPAYIINRWDFRAFYVSNFANQFLERIMFEPLFNIQDLNPNLYKKRKQFRSFTELKLQLIALKDYVYSCKRTGSLVISFLLLEPRHVLNKDLVNYFSLHDLIEIKRNSDFLPKLVRLVSDSKTHVLQCDVCCAKGFLCELCNNSSVNRSTNDIDLLFPFEIGRVRQCFACNSCYHDNCIKQNDFRCTKCIRINHRKLKSTQS